MNGTSDTHSVDTKHAASLDDSAKEAAEDLGHDYSLSEGHLDSSIHPGGSDALYKLASNLRSPLGPPDSEALQRQATLDGVNLGDEVLDPKSPKFDLYKWTRMTLRLVDEEGIKIKRAGVCFKNLTISGSGAALNLQKTVGGAFMAPFRLRDSFHRDNTPRQILHNFDGLLKTGELLLVLGRPGSGCSTFLKSLTGQMYGLQMAEDSEINYNGIPQKQMLREFKGEVIYNQEVDKHFPHLTVGETLEHAAALRMPQHRPLNTSREEAVKHITQVVMAVFGLSHTYNTKVGDDFVRGVSGGERKRVSIAEMALAGAAIAAWDNSTRGLDSATALSFVKSLRLAADMEGSTHLVAAYQASQAMFDLFDRVVVLYEGRQIYYGRASDARTYFERMGWYCPPRQTTGDFLTSVTNPGERKAIKGYEGKTPRTPQDFEQYWRNSPEYQALLREIQDHEQRYASNSGEELQAFRESKHNAQAKHVRPKSPYVVSVPMQVKLNTKRQFQRIRNNLPGTLAPIISNIIMALIIGSVYYGTPAATVGFQSKGAVIFFSVLLNAISAVTEINSLYSQRPIVEKHKSYAFYHPATEAISGVVADIPTKFLFAIAFNFALYFLSGLRYEPSQFFIFFLVNYVITFVMAAVFRTMAALTKTIAQAMALSGVMILVLVVYAGFVVSVPLMKDWFGWLRWINPIYYAFEILMANEFHGREFTCSQFIPAYPDLTGDQFICNIRGSVAGRRTVSGDHFLASAFEYYYSHVWRNFGILLAFLFGFMALYFIVVEINSETSSAAEVLVFRRGHVPSYMQSMVKGKGKASDEEQEASQKVASREEEEAGDVNALSPQTDVFTWKNVSYDIEIKGEPRRLLDEVSGYVKPGTLTALMGTSGAGKTTLLDVLAQRTSMGVVTGSMFVNGAPLDSSFQRKTGYVQQQDLHLETSTVREALRFSAMLRQPKTVSKQEKYAYVEDVIKMLNMADFAEAVVGIPGEGLNVEQRKLLTIGTELAAKPKLLLFLDEPTSGLDSQSSWAICAFLRKLADHGQAVLCTIHQPSAILFQQFDRLLFLRKGGQTVYFGKVGENSRALLDYFEGNGARKCGEDENPAEYMLEVVGDDQSDWVGTWKRSPENEVVRAEIEEIHRHQKDTQQDDDDFSNSEFAMPLSVQVWEVTWRVFQQYWRLPSYILAKMGLSIAAGLFIGFSFFQADGSLQGVQSVLYALFMFTSIFITVVQQIMPLFVTQRALYEVRERPSKAYSWVAFLIANMLVEIPYQIICGILMWATYYYPIVGVQSSERQILTLLLSILFFVYAATFAHMCIAAVPDAQTAGAFVTFGFAMTLIFNGVMQAPDALPGFWIFMHRVSHLTYFVASFASTALHGKPINCSNAEASIFQPPSNQTCGQYLQQFLTNAPGVLRNPDATSDCNYCQLAVADTFLAGFDIEWRHRWRDFAFMFAYIGFNMAMTVFLYWFFRVRTSNKKTKSQTVAKPSSTAPPSPPNEAAASHEKELEH